MVQSIQKKSKKAIALLITLFFIIAISLAIGIGLKQVNEAAAHVQSEKLLLQSSMIFDDVLVMLKGAKELDYLLDANISGDMFGAFLSGYSIPGIPLGDSGIIISLELQSARSKVNVNTLIDNNVSVKALRDYLNYYMVNDIYADMLLDSMGGIQVDDSYRTGLFYEKPYLYRDFIVSYEHLEEINEFYMQTYRDNYLKNINLKNLFYFSESKQNYKVDLNCVTPQALEMLLGDKNRVAMLFSNLESEDSIQKCSSIVCSNLDEDEKTILAQHGATCNVQPYLNVKVEVLQNNQTAKINFEYDMKNKKGYNFVYEI